MEFKSYQEVIEQIEKEEKNYIEIKEGLQLLPDLSFFIRIQMRKELKEKLNSIKENISYYLHLIDTFTTFEREDWFSFVTEYLSLTEQEEIVVTKFEKEYGKNKKESKHPFLDTLFYLDLNETDYLVSTKEDCKKIKERFKEENIKSAINSTKVQKYLLFSEEEEMVQVAHNKTIREKYQCFSSLQIAFERLIDLGLQNPELTAKERLNIVLEEAKKEDVKRNLII